MEAQDLGETIWYEVGQHVELRQIGNGEWVIFMNYSKYIWDAQDWERVKREGAA
jgi:hypothetical protein